MFNFLKKKEVSYPVNGLVVDPALPNKEHLFTTPFWDVPRYVDMRSYIVPYEERWDNQKNTPQCVVYTVTAAVEAEIWKRTHRIQQLDPNALYVECKKIDGNNEEGTRLESGFSAAKNLKYIPANADYKLVTEPNEIMYALHEGHIVVTAFHITDKWFNPDIKTGFISYSNKDNYVGYHAVPLFFYFKDHSKYGTHFGISLRSWGTNVGINGDAKINMDCFKNQFVYGIVIKM